MPIHTLFYRFWPGLVGAGVALAFIAVVLVVPNLGGGACMESYPMHCPVVELVGSGLAATGIGLMVCVLVIFFASASKRSSVRISGAVVGFAALVIVMIVGANLSLVHTVEVRYY